MNMKSTEFIDQVRKFFGFLKEEYGFTDHPKGIGYIKNELEIEFYCGKGELEVIFFVRRDDNIFRPYVSRSFDLLAIVKRLKTGKIEFPASFQNYVVDMGGVDEHLSFYASLMKKYCSSQLDGDLSIFETIHMERRNKA